MTRVNRFRHVFAAPLAAALAGLLLLALACNDGGGGGTAATPTPPPQDGGAIHVYMVAFVLQAQPAGAAERIVARPCFAFAGGGIPADVQALADLVEVTGTMEGPDAVVTTATGTTGQEGCVDLTFAISQPGSYTIRIAEASHPAGTYEPAENLVPSEGTLDVGPEDVASS